MEDKIIAYPLDGNLIHELGDIRWTTLCILLYLSDQNRECSFSQAKIAKYLGVTRQTANERIQNLLKFRYKDKPLVTIIGKSGWTKVRNIYKIDLPA